MGESTTYRDPFMGIAMCRNNALNNNIQKDIDTIGYMVSIACRDGGGGGGGGVLARLTFYYFNIVVCSA